MNNEQLHRDLGRVEGKLGALTNQVSGVERKLDDTSKKLDEALAYISEQKGASRRTVFISSGASAVVAAIIGWAIAWFR